MDIKKLLMIGLAAGSLTVFTACGDDDDNGNGGGDGGTCELTAPVCDLGADIQPTAGCLDEVGESQRVRISSIVIPDSADAIGFNLDCTNTGGAGEFGCVADTGDGVDNALASLAGLLVNFDVDLNAQIEEGITTENIVFEIVITGWNGEAEDGCVVLGLESLDPDTMEFVPVAEPVAGVVTGGSAKALIDALPLVIPFGDAETGYELLTVNVENAVVDLPLATGGITDGLIGGHVVWMVEGSEQDLESLVRGVIESLDSDVITFEIAEGLIVDSLDIYVEGTSADACSCDALSVGLQVSGATEPSVI